MNDNALNSLISAIAALIEAMSMQAENKFRELKGESLAYGEDSFLNLINKHNLTGF